MFRPYGTAEEAAEKVGTADPERPKKAAQDDKTRGAFAAQLKPFPF
jgi:hypothetical protein